MYYYVEEIRNIKMNATIATSQDYQLPHKLTPRDDNKKIVSEFLKRADELIRKGSLDQAQLVIAKVKEKDPKNIYALALEERILTLQKEIECAKSKEQTVPAKVNPNKATNNPKLSTFQNNNAFIQKPISNSQKIQNAPKAPLTTNNNFIEKANKNTKDANNIIDRSIELESYKQSLVEAWSNGCPSLEIKRSLAELQQLLEITPEEHQALERNVKRESYKNALMHQLSHNPSILADIKSLTALQQSYAISNEEHSQIQMQILNLLQQKPKEKVLIIDDDARLLEMLAESLENNGFDVIALSTSDEAYALLRKFIPDLILCDINLETSTMGGFTFYEKVQELKNVQTVPFIFLTGLTDETLIRTGKELGVDDYLTKPISEQTLVSTIRGKLKRFKQLKNSVNPTPTTIA